MLAPQVAGLQGTIRGEAVLLPVDCGFRSCWGQTVIWAFLVAQMVKNLSLIRETWVRSLGWEDPLEEGMATHSSILPWRIPWAEAPGRLQSTGSQRIRYD